MELKKYVELTGLPQKVVAYMLKISPYALSNYINGRRTPTLEIADRIIDLTLQEVSIKDLLKTAKKRKKDKDG